MIERRPDHTGHGGLGRTMTLLAGLAWFCAAHASLLALSPDDPPAQGALADVDKKRVASLENEREDLLKAGKFPAAIRPAREILTIRSRSQPAGHWEVRTAREQLRSCERLAAMPPAQQERMRIAWDTFSQGSGEIEKRRFDKAEPLFKKALETFRDGLGEEDFYTLNIDNELGAALYQQAFYDQAAEVFRRELSGYRRLFDEVHPNTASAHDMLAVSLHALGDDDGALDHGRKALETFIRLQGDTSEDAAMSYNNTGSYLESRGDYDEAEKSYRRGLEIFRKVLGEDNRETARSYNNVAVLLYKRGRFREAADLNRNVLRIRRKVLDETHEDVARSEDNLANCLDEQGEFAEAEKRHRMAFTVRLQALGEDHPETILSLCNLGFNLRSQGRYDEAETTWAKAALGFERARLRVASAGLERAAFSAARSPMTALAVLLARRNKPREAWERLESNLGRGLVDELAARDARPLQPTERQREQELLDKLQAAEDRITRAQLPGDVARPGVEQLKTEKDNLQADFDSFERGLVERYGVPSGQVYGLERIQRHLASDVALVGWVDLDLPRQAPAWNREHWAVLVRSQGEPTWVRLTGSGPGGDWTDDDQNLPQRAREMVSNRPAPGAKDWRELAGRLARQRLGPLRDHLQTSGTLPSVGHLVILPSPALDGVPVEVLLDAWKTEDRPLTASYVPSGTIYAWLRERRVERNIAGRSGGPGKLLAVGNPVLPSSAPVAQPSLRSPAEGTTGLVSRLNRRRDKLGPLPGTEKEIQAIAGLFKTPAPTLLLGADANERNLNQLARDGAMKQFDVIHLATHGIVDDHVPMRFALLLSGQRSTRTPEAKNSGEEDGYGLITAGQVLRTWKLDADLVTLSACQTALGKTSGGEGQIGFAQALFRAGSQSLILSLWKVDDEATAMLMTDFYGEYTKHIEPDDRGRRKAAALHHATSTLRTSGVEQRKDNPSDQSRGREVKGADATKRGRKPPYDHPYYWAGFVLIGDPQ
jgi:CHAT domain-containing protein/tetratricopeptide (TPR) repeat protein